MTSRISPPPSVMASKSDDSSQSKQSPTKSLAEEEWVEIIEPKSKTKIYANLDSGVCAKSPPEGVTVSKADDFDDHWWELFDKKTGKYYYYNPEQQKTVWTKPSISSSASSNGSINGKLSKKRLLIIPVSKLQTYKRLSPVSERNSYQQVSKCDAFTQTIASNLVTTGTQTLSESELCEKLNEVQIQCNNREQQTTEKEPQSPRLSKLTPSNRISSRIAEYQNAFKSQQQMPSWNNRQLSEPKRKSSYTTNKKTPVSISNDGIKSQSSDQSQTLDQTDFAHSLNRSSHGKSTDENPCKKSDQNLQTQHDRNHKEDGSIHDYFGPPPPPPPPVSYQSNRRSVHLRENPATSSFRPDESSSSIATPATSTFKNSPSNSPARPLTSSSSVDVATTSSNTAQRKSPQSEIVSGKNDAPKAVQPVATNNLSHYLVREARAMGIALISDDELDDDDQESDDEFANDDDEDTDLRDDLSSTKELGSDLHASQELGEDSSEGGWRSFSDQESPNAQPHEEGAPTRLRPPTVSNSRRKYKLQRPPPGEPKVPDSPISCETASTAFRYDNHELIDDQKDPASCMSQQLDHRKLVENFKKTRQTSALGFNDSLSRSYRLDANNAVQRLKTVADTYFNNTGTGGNALSNAQDNPNKTNDRYLRHLSAFSTLPRPLKTKPPQVPQDADLEFDADYDVVEENCSYYSDTERRLASMAQSSEAPLNSSKVSAASKALGYDISSPVTTYFDRNKSTRGSTFSVESFARENLSRHPKKGGLIFNRKVKWSRMISWTKTSIKQPMISSVSSDLAPESIASFKLIQQFMGDRKITMGKRYRQLLKQSGLTEQEISSMTHRKSLGRSGSLNASNALNSSSTNIGGNASNGGAGSAANHIPDRLRDELAFELTSKGCTQPTLRDEIFVQLARQLTENPSADSTNWGLVLMSIMLNYFSPSSKFAPFLLSFLETHANLMARDVCLPRLEKRLRQTGLTYCRKPADGNEISIVRLSITKWPQYCGIFGESLERIMSLQTCSPYLKTLRLPWILTILGEKLLETGGAETEGVFRCAADHDLLAQLRLEIDCVDFRKITDASQLKSLLSNVDDPHVIAGLLKLFFRQLPEPVFPARIYDACLASCNEAALACRIFNERLPNLNKDVVAYLTRLLQMLSDPEKVLNTRMDTANLSMVWAPNLLRAPEQSNDTMATNYNTAGGVGSRSGSKWSISNGSTLGDEQLPQQQQPSLSQSMIFEQTRQEMQFIKLLITNLDTSFIENVL